MKKLLKVLAFMALGVAALVVVVVGAAFGYVFVVLPKSRPPQPLVAPTDPAGVERGRYLAENVYQCVWCHSPLEPLAMGGAPKRDETLTGRDLRVELPDIAVITPNISSDRAYGVGAWSDGEIVRALREGIRKDGSPLFDLMPYKTYREKMSEEDALAIAAYLKASPSRHTPSAKYELPLPAVVFGRRMSPRPVDHSFPGVAEPGKARGEWLLTVALCHLCHDASDGHGGSVPGRELAGGSEVRLLDGSVVIAPNISSDPVAGIGAYTEDELVAVLSEGRNKGGRILRGMPWANYKGLTADDKRSIAVALKASPAVH